MILLLFLALLKVIFIFLIVLIKYLFITILFQDKKMQRAVLFVMVLSCLFVTSLGCSRWNLDKPCMCGCEDDGTACFKRCSEMVYFWEKRRCYDDCASTVTACYDNC